MQRTGEVKRERATLIVEVAGRAAAEIQRSKLACRPDLVRDEVVAALVPEPGAGRGPRHRGGKLLVHLPDLRVMMSLQGITAPACQPAAACRFFWPQRGEGAGLGVGRHELWHRVEPVGCARGREAAHLLHAQN